MHAYQEKHGHLPPAVVYGQDGRPLYSWRALILPYLDEAIANEFHFDEPWDSPHNLALLPRMPYDYALPPRKAAQMKMSPGYTICHVFVGPGTPFEEGKTSLSRDFSSGDTILIIEAGEPVPWTKPVDLQYDPKGSLPDLSSPFRDCIRLVSVSCLRRHIPKDLDEKALRAGITRRGQDWLDSGW
jgi:hypothetical protein